MPRRRGATRAADDDLEQRGMVEDEGEAEEEVRRRGRDGGSGAGTSGWQLRRRRQPQQKPSRQQPPAFQAGADSTTLKMLVPVAQARPVPPTPP